MIKSILKREWDRLSGRCRYSLAGLQNIWVEEHSFRFWTYINLLSVCAILVLPVAVWARVLVLCLGILILAAECLNSAIERVVDHLSPDPHPLAKAAKDAGSAGVAVTALAAGVAWIGAIWTLL